MWLCKSKQHNCRKQKHPSEFLQGKPLLILGIYQKQLTCNAFWIHSCFVKKTHTHKKTPIFFLCIWSFRFAGSHSSSYILLNLEYHYSRKMHVKSVIIGMLLVRMWSEIEPPPHLQLWKKRYCEHIKNFLFESTGNMSAMKTSYTMEKSSFITARLWLRQITPNKHLKSKKGVWGNAKCFHVYSICSQGIPLFLSFTRNISFSSSQYGPSKSGIM